MARLEDIPQPTRDAVVVASCPVFETQPFVVGPPLAQRRVVIVSSAALIRRGGKRTMLGACVWICPIPGHQKDPELWDRLGPWPGR